MSERKDTLAEWMEEVQRLGTQLKEEHRMQPVKDENGYTPSPPHRQIDMGKLGRE